MEWNTSITKLAKDLTAREMNNGPILQHELRLLTERVAEPKHRKSAPTRRFSPTLAANENGRITNHSLMLSAPEIEDIPLAPGRAEARQHVRIALPPLDKPMNAGDGMIDDLVLPILAFVTPAHVRISSNMVIATGCATHRIVAHLTHVEGDAKESAEKLTMFDSAFVVFGDDLMVGNQALSPKHLKSIQQSKSAILASSQGDDDSAKA
jgi:hypothetical protein